MSAAPGTAPESALAKDDGVAGELAKGELAKGELAAIVLTGGGAERLGGVDKTQLVVEGITSLDRVLWAVRGAVQIVVVGPVVPVARPGQAVDRPVRFTRESPIGGGPVAAIAAGVAMIDPGIGSETERAAVKCVAIVAGDMPGITQETLARLRGASGTRGGVLMDKQFPSLCALVPLEGLRDALETRPRSWRALIETIAPALVPGTERELRDLDAPEDLAYWHVRLEQ